ncbi:MAG TPA: nitroreductase family protein [Marinobacter sp.]
MNALLTRHSTLPVDPLFLARWSPRAFDGHGLPEEDLLILFEAARWAPSAYNKQPWRFLYALPGDAHWTSFVALLDPFNASWAQHAGALIFLLSDTDSPTHRFDAGAAWIQLALQAHQLGYQAHAMAGILHDAIRHQLSVPDRLQVEIGIAVGAPGDPDTLPEPLRQREFPSDRLPLEQLIQRGSY